MKPTYTSTNQIELTQIADKFCAPSQLRHQLSSAHSALVNYVINHYRNTNKYRQQVCDSLNIITYCVINKEVPPFDWSITNPFETIPDYDMEEVENTINTLVLRPEAIIWDVEPVDTITFELEQVAERHVPIKTATQINAPKPTETTTSSFKPAFNKEELEDTSTGTMGEGLFGDYGPEEGTVQRVRPTRKEDLWLAPPLVPTFDRNKIWLEKRIGNDTYTIDMPIPEIPYIQRHVNITTDPSQMTDAEFMRLYPDTYIKTRRPRLYDRIEGMDYDEQLGCIIPVQGFTREQVLDNMIKYPHFYRLRRIVDPEAYANNVNSYVDGIAGFYQDIEIEGELVSTLAVWDQLPESRIIPKEVDFIKEYVIRRYLLERDAGIEHKYNLYGVLEPFITLFMTPEMYEERGYVDTLGIVKQCVRSRILFYRSINPFLKRIGVDWRELPLSE